MKLYFWSVGIKFDLITHNFKLEFVDSGLYFVQDFVQDENNSIRILIPGIREGISESA